MPGPVLPFLPLLDLDPDLAGDLSAEDLAAAHRRLHAHVLQLHRGEWATPPGADGASVIGHLVVDGLLVRETTVGDHPCAELLGPGDLLRLRPAGDGAEDLLLPRETECTVLEPVRLAIIDAELLRAASAFPAVLTSLIDRAAQRAERVVVLQAITHLTRVDDRLLALFWYLAERWGRVGPEGVALALRLPHRTLAGMVGARRPSVTTALGQLVARGEVERREDGALVLRGGPPEPADRGRANGHTPIGARNGHAPLVRRAS